MRILVSAGEPSGDQRGAEVISRLQNTEAFGMGGPALAASGMELTADMSEYAVMGFAEVVSSLPSFLKLEKKLAEEAVRRKADCILLVDYPGFNMRLGRRLKRAGFPVIQYVAPQMWAWGSWRVGKLKRSCDLLMTLFRFEEDFFRTRGVNASFTGHPLRDRISGNLRPGTALGLLPGSRAQEVGRLLPEMIEAFRLLREKGTIRTAMLAVSDHLDRKFYAIAEREPGVTLVNSTGEVLRNSAAALVCSGTATLETALYKVPFTVCYRTSAITYAMAERLVRGVDCIGMANIVAGTQVAPELIQNEATAENMAASTEKLLKNTSEITGKLELVRTELGPPDAAGQAAKRITTFLRERNET
ncbi:lipid-A-disaccharide synthase [Candidatus Fermentibacteria bacterium]|nr:MAG: lipid-A-disaccharide synthase [Candidatus Fermentibacteria bacterium]